MNYGQLRTQFKNILNRSDCTDALADTFIAQGLARSQRILRTPAQEKTVTVTTTGSFTAFPVPNDLLAVINFSADDKYLTFVPTARWQEFEFTMPGKPEYWTRIGSEIKLKPTPAADIVLKLNYYGEFPEFTNDSTETVLSIIAPDLVVYGGLTFAADYFIDERKDAFESRWQQSVMELQDQAYGVEGPASIYPAYNFGDY